MRFIKRTSLLCLACLASLSNAAVAKELPALKTKQSLDNIRFLSQDGKHTYYQRRSGDLQMSTNYSNEMVLEGEKLSEYLLYSSPARKKLVVEVDDSFHSQISHHKNNRLFVMDFGGVNAVEKGKGVAPGLHQDDRFMSYFVPKEKKINIQDLSIADKLYSIKLLNPVNPFFLPQVFMPTPADVVYSDINESGHEAFLSRSLLDASAKTVFKSAYPGSKLEGCLREGILYVGEFERGGGKGGSKILKIPLFNNKDYQQSKILYQSQQADIGNMICAPEGIYFVKTTSYIQELNLKDSEVAFLSFADNKTAILSDLKRVTQLLEMDGMILAPLSGTYYVVKGAESFLNDELKSENDA